MHPEILEVFIKLDKLQQELLSYANREMICQHVEYEPGKYIGVDATYNKKLVPILTDGLWSIGILKESL